MNLKRLNRLVLTKALATGRCAIYNFDLDGTNLVIAIIYGWAGGKKGNEAAARTDDLLTIVQNELNAMDPGPKMIMGDINAGTEALPTILQMMAEEGWTDVGSVSHLCGGTPNRPTCHANANAKESRIDYIFVNEYLLPAIEACSIDTDDTFATHRPLKVRIKTGRIVKQLKTLRKTTNYAELLETKIQQVAKEETEQAEDGKVGYGLWSEHPPFCRTGKYRPPGRATHGAHQDRFGGTFVAASFASI